MDDRFPRGPKVKRAAIELGGGKRARARVLAVWADAMAYCNLNLTDGCFPDHELDELPDSDPAAVFQAMAVGDERSGAMVERIDGGWQFRNYEEYQPTKADVEATRQRTADRQKAWRERQRNGVTKRLGDVTSQSPDPARPDPARPEVQEQPQDQEPAATRRMLRLELKPLRDVEPQVRAAIHAHLDAHPDAPDGDLVEEAKVVAASCHATGYKGNDITKLVDAVRGTRARRMA